MSILTLQIAKDHLVITDTDHDAPVQRALDNAEGIVKEWIGPDDWDPSWTTPEALPGVVYQAILFQLGDVYENKGDNLADRDKQANEAMVRLLWRKHTPGVA